MTFNSGMGGPSLSSNVANLGGDSTQAFVDCVLLYAKNLEADAVSIELQVYCLSLITNAKYRISFSSWRSRGTNCLGTLQ